MSAHSPLRLLLTAVQFYTRLPVPPWVGHSDAQLAAATPYFPLVGVLIGALTGALYVAATLVFTPWIAAVLALGCGVLLTGAFHEDGFADVCDGFGGGYTPARVLEIMQDSRVGAFGAIGIGLLLLLQAASLAALPVGSGLAALVAAHALSRALALTVAWRLPYVRTSGGKAKPVVNGLGGGAITVGLVIGLVPLVVYGARFGSGLALLALGLAALVVAVAAMRFRRRIGGYTGDCLGAAQQLAFTALLLGFAARL